MQRDILLASVVEIESESHSRLLHNLAQLTQPFADLVKAKAI